MPPLKYDRALLLFGPESSVINHAPNDRSVEVFRGIDTSADVLVEATFHNPYSVEGRYWEHGFLLRHSRVNYLHWVSIDSDGDWQHFHRLDESDGLDRITVRSSDINTAPGGENILTVVMTGATGRLYINGKYQGGLDLKAITGKGEINVFVDDDSAGRTRFEDFGVWKWDEALAGQLPAPILPPVAVEWETYELDKHDFKVDIPTGWVGDEPFATPFMEETVTFDDGSGEGICQSARGWFDFQSPDRIATVSFEWDFWGDENRSTRCFWKHSVSAQDIADINEEDEVIFSDYVTRHGERRNWQYLHHVRSESEGGNCAAEERATLVSLTRHYILEVEWSACQHSVERYREVLDQFLDSFSSRDAKIR